MPCGQGKIWDKYPKLGAVAARDAYTEAPFKVNREYAERFGDRWVILSAKYGFVSPDFPISGPYNVTFKRRATGPIRSAKPRKQVEELGLGEYDRVIGLGGKEYREMIREAFKDTPTRICFPFAGLPIGKAMGAVKRAVGQGGRGRASYRYLPASIVTVPAGSTRSSAAGQPAGAPRAASLAVSGLSRWHSRTTPGWLS